MLKAHLTSLNGKILLKIMHVNVAYYITINFLFEMALLSSERHPQIYHAIFGHTGVVVSGLKTNVNADFVCENFLLAYNAIQ